MTLNSTQREVINQIVAITESFGSSLRAYTMSAHNGKDPQFDDYFAIDSIKESVARLKEIILEARNSENASTSSNTADSSTSSTQDSKDSKTSKDSK